MFKNIKISIIAAMSNNNVIGLNNQLPWHLPKDMEHFKKLTLGKNLLMGKNTFESIFAYINKPLPQRNNFVLTNSVLNLEAKYANFENVKFFNSFKTLEEFMHNNEQTQLYIIGGEKIYKQMVSCADELIISHVNINCEGDAFFPKIDLNTWKIESEELRQDKIDFIIRTYKKII